MQMIKAEEGYPAQRYFIQICSPTTTGRMAGGSPPAPISDLFVRNKKAVTLRDNYSGYVNSKLHTLAGHFRYK